MANNYTYTIAIDGEATLLNIAGDLIEFAKTLDKINRTLKEPYQPDYLI